MQVKSRECSGQTAGDKTLEKHVNVVILEVKHLQKVILNQSRMSCFLATCDHNCTLLMPVFDSHDHLFIDENSVDTFSALTDMANHKSICKA